MSIDTRRPGLGALLAVASVVVSRQAAFTRGVAVAVAVAVAVVAATVLAGRICRELAGSLVLIWAATASSYLVGGDAALDYGVFVVSAIFGWRLRRELVGAAVLAWRAVAHRACGGRARGDGGPSELANLVLGPGLCRVPGDGRDTGDGAAVLLTPPATAPTSNATSDDTLVGTSLPALATSAAFSPTLRAPSPFARRWRAVALPPPSLLSLAPAAPEAPVDAEAEAALLVDTLAAYGVGARVEASSIGPTVATYEAALKRGTRVAKVAALAPDLSLAFGRTVRVAKARTMGRIAFEIARAGRARVDLRELAEEGVLATGGELPLLLGRGTRGEAMVVDLAAEPHLLVAGATGSGKSVGLSAMIGSLLLARSPAELELVLVDPKQVELAPYAGIPHVRRKIVTEAESAAHALDELAAEMDTRYAILAGARCRALEAFNKLTGEVHLRRIVVVVDELADLLAAGGRAVEAPLVRLLAKGRAAGVHLILATQRPSADVVSGTMKANVPGRVCYRVASGVDSRLVLDEGGAENLAGKGDALVRTSRADGLVRVQAPWVSERDVDAICDFLRAGARTAGREAA